jgi:outer membrane protein OmpU
MKKILIATTALVATAGVAAADVTLSGYGRFGADYQSGATGDAAKTQVVGRMRINIDASTETDSGVKFGGKVRLQYNTNTLNGVSGDFVDGAANVTSATTLNPAMLYAEFGGARLEVFNSNTAIDSVKLMYNSEIGYLNRSFGGPIGGFAAYSSTPYAADILGTDDVASNRMGVFGSYAFGTGNVRVSMINPNQGVKSNARTAKTEVSVSADYVFGQFTVAAAYADNANTVDGDTSLFLGAEYAVMPNANVGLLFAQNKDKSADTKRNRTTIYGNYTMDAYTFRGYIADDNAARNLVKTTDTSFGLGLDYAMGGGTRLSADIHRNYSKDTVAGVGVRFNF